MSVNGCQRQHVEHGDVLLDQWDQAAIRAVLDAAIPLPSCSAKFISAVQRCPELEEHFYSLTEVCESVKRLHATMTKLQILGLVDPKKGLTKKELEA